MCLIGIRLAADAAWPIVIAGNRDEFHLRPTDPARIWPERAADDARILAGRDREAGGTWMGLAWLPADGGRAGRLRFGALTNVRPGLMPAVQPAAPAAAAHVAAGVAPSRGELVSGWLADGGGQLPLDWVEQPATRRSAYAGFNLLTLQVGRGQADPDDPLCWRTALLSNLDCARPTAPADGLHLITNTRVGEHWPKTRRLGIGMQAALTEQGADRLADRLLDVLGDRTEATPGEQPPTGLDPDRERRLSAVFIAAPDYGTRCSTVILLSRHGDGLFVERRFGPAGVPLGETRQAFRI